MAACGGACAEWLDLVDGVVWAHAYSMCELVVQKLLASLNLLRSVVRVKEIFFCCCCCSLRTMEPSEEGERRTENVHIDKAVVKKALSELLHEIPAFKEFVPKKTVTKPGNSSQNIEQDSPAGKEPRQNLL